MKRYLLLAFLLLPLKLILAGTDVGTGTVKGTLCYPSDYVPQMQVYLRNVKTKKVYQVTVKENQKTFQFNQVPEGTYVAYAYTTEKLLVDEQNKSTKASGGYSHFVPCGMSVNCKDHSLIAFKVLRGKTVNNIKVCDWYGAEVPLQ